jgi:LemA protein
MKTGIIIAIIVVAGILIGSYVVSYYNRFVTQSEAIDNQWAQVENQLKRRFDLIPNLVNTAKGYMEFEKEVFENLAEARSNYAGATTTNEKVAASNQIESALARLLVIVENYPNLKTNETFIRLMDELAGTENRIATERRRYNETVRTYNVSIKRFPGNIFAGLFGREAAIYFEVPEAEMEVPEVDFGGEES